MASTIRRLVGSFAVLFIVCAPPLTRPAAGACTGDCDGNGEVTVRDIYLAFEERVAYTTLMTTLDRLYKKQILARRKDGRAFLYAPAVSREEFDHGIREDVIDGLFNEGASGIQPLLACIVDTVSERDREMLDELDRLVKEKKRELRRKSE